MKQHFYVTTQHLKGESVPNQFEVVAKPPIDPDEASQIVDLLTATMPNDDRRLLAGVAISKRTLIGGRASAFQVEAAGPDTLQPRYDANEVGHKFSVALRGLFERECRIIADGKS
jgi:hypothetical protein